jgi:hypothetical protein
VIDRGSQGGWAITPDGIGFFSFPDSGPLIEFFRFSSAAITQGRPCPKARPFGAVATTSPYPTTCAGCFTARSTASKATSC